METFNVIHHGGILPSRVLAHVQSTQTQTSHEVLVVMSDDDEVLDYRTVQSSLSSARSTEWHINSVLHTNGDVIYVMTLKLSMPSSSRRQTLPVGGAVGGHRSLVPHNAYGMPEALPSIDWMGSYPYILYNIITYHKVNVIGLGWARLLCDMKNAYLQLHSTATDKAHFCRQWSFGWHETQCFSPILWALLKI